MADIVTPEVRSRMMSGIRGKDTKPEKLIRSGLHRLGYRYRLHAKELPGKPDMVFPKCRAVIFVHGCFWHGHDCQLYRLPATRREFWEAKIASNRRRDEAVRALLTEEGWRVMEIWECALRGKTALPLEKILSFCDKWLQSGPSVCNVRGKP